MVLEKIPLSEIGALFAVFQVTGSLVAAYLAYEVYRYDRLSRAWLSVVAALLLLLFGFWGMKYKFESFEILEKRVGEKVRSFMHRMK